MDGNRLSRGAWCWLASGLVASSALSISSAPTCAQSPKAVAARTSRFGAAKVTVHMSNAPVSMVVDEIVRQAGLSVAYSKDLLPVQRRISVSLNNVAADDAFRIVLQGTNLEVTISESGRAVVRALPVDDVDRSGVITGTVVNAATRQPMHNVAVLLDGEVRGVVTDAAGLFRVTGVSTGQHRVTVRMLGYIRQTTVVSVTDGETATVTIALEPSVNALDQVVVTGTVIPTELKAVPSALTVITAKEIERRGITQIEQLFRGDVPGLFALREGSGQLLDQVTVYSRGATTFTSASAGTNNGTNPIKTFVDGVEMVNASYLSQIDPRSIERIEILTGPQASTIYGSNALNGVMQIFTKRGVTSTPQLSLTLLSGWIENSFNRALAPQSDYAASASGTEGRMAYNAGGSWNYIGRWTPAKQTTRTDAFGGTRFQMPARVGNVTADVSLRLSNVQNVQHGDAAQGLTELFETGLIPPSNIRGRAQPRTSVLNGQTLGISLVYAPSEWWSHELTLGRDATITEDRVTDRGYTSPSDTSLLLNQVGVTRRSQRYSMTLRTPTVALVQATMTAGGDAWQTLTSQVGLQPQILTGTLTSASYTVARTPDHNAGGFLQTQVGIGDRLFLTYGARAEWNPAFGAEVTPVWSPRYGAAYTHEAGAITAKLRVSYGRSTRPPRAGDAKQVSLIDTYGYGNSTLNLLLPYYGNIVATFANPELMPEHQQGGEGGFELYLGTRGSLVVTRYNQTIDGLINNVTVDSARTLTACSSACSGSSHDADGYAYFLQREFLNVGNLRNQGWETQATTNFGLLSAKGTYSWTKSRVLGVTPKYRAAFSRNAAYQPGATFQYLAEHTWAVDLVYTTGRTTVNVHTNGSGQARVDFNAFYLENLNSLRLQQSMASLNGSKYVSFNTPYALTDVNVSSRLTSAIEGVMQIQNLTNRNTHDTNNIYPTIGRQSKLGVRIRW